MSRCELLFLRLILETCKCSKRSRAVLGASPQVRRRWSDEFKTQVVAKALEPGASVSAIVHRIGIHRRRCSPGSGADESAQLMALVDGMDCKRVRTVTVKPPEIVEVKALRRSELAASKKCSGWVNDVADRILPNDIETLRAMGLPRPRRRPAPMLSRSPTSRTATPMPLRIERLIQVLKAFDRARFGGRSEKARPFRTATPNSRPSEVDHRCDQGPGQQGTVSNRMASVHCVGARASHPIWNDRAPWRGVAECGSPRSPAWAGSVSWR